MRVAIGQVAVLGFLLLLSTQAIHAQECANSLEYAFGVCQQNKITAYPYFTDDACVGQALPGIVPGLNCSYECPGGTRLAINHVTTPKTLRCEKCKAGTYSVGGGDIYADWENMPIEFHTDCFEYRNRGWYTKTTCKPWHADGPIVHSGNNTDNHNMLSILYLTLTFVKDGYVQFRWRVDAQVGGDGMIFTIDDITQGFGYQSHQLDWVESRKYPVKKGSHTLKWEFFKDPVLSYGRDRAEIQMVKAVGSRASDVVCTPCVKGQSAEGSDKCSLCGENQYTDTSLDTHSCRACPPNTFSFPGAVGNASCIPSRPCVESDYIANYTACTQVNGAPKRTKFYSWALPHVCNTSLPGSLPLPAATPDTYEDCAHCNPGTQRIAASDGQPAVCQYCADNEYGDGNSCTACGEGKHASKQLYFQYWYTWPEGFVSTCSAVSVNGKCPPEFGWQLNQDAIVSGHNHFSHTDMTLKYTVEIVAVTGYVSFTFKIENPKQYAGLTLYIDGVLVGDPSRKNPAFTTEKWPLSAGTHTIVWDYQRRHENPLSQIDDRAVISQIVFTGTKSGGAKECLPCELGQKGVGSLCESCPPGYYQDEKGQTSCKPCLAGQYQDRPGQTQCLPCGKYTTSPGRSANCSSSGTMDYQPADPDRQALQFNLEGLLRRDGTMWGPLPLDMDPEGRARNFHLGLLTTGHAKYANGSKVDIPLYAVELRERHNSRRELCTDKTNHPCMDYIPAGRTPDVSFIPYLSSLGDNSTIVQVSYTQGDPCPDNPAKTLSTRISMYCAMEAGEGAPYVKRQSLTKDWCTFDVVWNTQYACPLCNLDSYTAIRAENCDKSGKRGVTYVRNMPCVGGLPLPQPRGENCTFTLIDTTNAERVKEAENASANNKRKALYFGIGGAVFLSLCVLLVVMYVKSHNHGARVEAELKNLKTEFGDSLLRAANEGSGEHDEEVLLSRIEDDA